MAIIRQTNLSEISNYRIDSEYYKPKQLNIHNQLLSVPNMSLIGLTKVNGGKRLPKGEGFSETGYPYVRVVDINNGFITDEKVAYIEERIWKKIAQYDIKKDDILVTIVGNTVGLTGILNKDLGVANFTENCARVREPKIDQYYLAAFLQSKYGQNQVDREKVGTSQPKLSLDRLRKFRIFIPKEKDVDSISKLVRSSSELLLSSQALYKQATELLEKDLGLDKVNFKKPNSYIASFSEVTTSRRMNAEYFSPAVKHILKQPFLKDSKSLATIFQVIRGTTPKQYLEEGVPVLKTKNIRVPEIDRSKISDFVINKNEFTTIQENDLLLASMGVGSLGRMSYIQELDQDYVVDGTIRILRRKGETPENFEIPTLLFLSSEVGQELIYRGIVGSTGIISLPDDYLHKIPLPNFSADLCKKVTDMVRQSIIARKESKKLLEQAKIRVEQLIEEGAKTN